MNYNPTYVDPDINKYRVSAYVWSDIKEPLLGEIYAYNIPKGTKGVLWDKIKGKTALKLGNPKRYLLPVGRFIVQIVDVSDPRHFGVIVMDKNPKYHKFVPLPAQDWHKYCEGRLLEIKEHGK